MKYSTLKKTVAFSVASLVLAGVATAQDSTKTVKTMKMADTTTTAKVFGGLGQYKTFSLGINAGVTSQALATGGSTDFNKKQISWGVGVSARQALSHAFSLRLDVNYGEVKGQEVLGGVETASYTTKYWQPALSGVVNVGNISFLHRKNAISFFGSAGAGLAIYQPDPVFNGKDENYNHHVWEYVIPVGVGVRFKLSDNVNLNFGYTENFIDGDNFDGWHRGYPTKDHYSYGYAGLEWTLGSKSKPNIEWVNPVAVMYDELYDEALRQEVAALKTRVGAVEGAVNDLKKDTDGDGVSDQFDKCPGTPAGTVVDGSGCPLKLDTAAIKKYVLGDDSTANGSRKAYSNIQFDFDSSVLRTSSYPALDATSADLRSSSKTVEIDGFASSEGTAQHNLVLSKDRANSVKTYLINSGVDAKRLKVKGYGETHPIADNSTEAGRILNRRVQFKTK